ncbi:MAG TPA: hypothetical protein VMJ10_25790 [Kofleriaceae bacterium]|nr:hypothetical protein [Kofleriaceae bacterium]
MTRIEFAATLAIVVSIASPAVAGTLATGHDRDRDVRARPPSCEQFVGEPRDAISVMFRWDQQLSLAACEATIEVPRIEPGDVRALPGLVSHLERTLAASISLYRDAMSFAPPEARILAAYGLASVHLEIVVRARAALAPDDTRSRCALEPLLDDDLRAATAAFDEVGFLAEDFPKAAHANEVVEFAVASAAGQARLLRNR